MTSERKLNPAPDSKSIIRNAIGDDIKSSFGIRPVVSIRIFDADGGFKTVNVDSYALRTNSKRVIRGVKQDITRSDLSVISKAMSEAGVTARAASTVATHVGMEYVNREWDVVKSAAQSMWTEEFSEPMPASELGKLKGQFMQELLRPTNTLPSGKLARDFWSNIESKVSDEFESEVWQPTEIEMGKYKDEDIAVLNSQIGVVFDVLDDAADQFSGEGAYASYKDWKYDYIDPADVALTNPDAIIGLLGLTGIHELADIIRSSSVDSKGKVIGLDSNKSYNDFRERYSVKLSEDAKRKASGRVSTGSFITSIMAASERETDADRVLKNFKMTPLDEDDLDEPF